MYKLTLQILLICSFLISCGESDFEIETRNEYSSIIRRIDDVHLRLNNDSEELMSKSRSDSKELFNNYIENFASISEDLAAAPNATKFDSLRNNLSEIVTFSDEYVNAKNNIVEEIFELQSKRNGYDRKYDIVKGYIDDYLKVRLMYQRNVLLDLIQESKSNMVKDSLESEVIKSSINKNLYDLENLITSFKIKNKDLNSQLVELEFVDTLKAYNNFVKIDQSIIEMYERQSAILNPTEDITTYIRN